MTFRMVEVKAGAASPLRPALQIVRDGFAAQMRDALAPARELFADQVSGSLAGVMEAAKVAVGPLVEQMQQTTRGLAEGLRPLLVAAARAARRVAWLRLLADKARRGMERARQLGRWLLGRNRRPRRSCEVRQRTPRAPPADFQTPTTAAFLSVVVATGPPRPAGVAV
jgi:hypothetical protein